MIKKIISIDSPASLNTENEQLKISNRNSGDINIIPIEDIGILIVENQQIVLNSSLIGKLMSNNIALIVCDNRHLPIGQMLSFEGNYEQTERIRLQTTIKLPTKKKLWQQIIIQKIYNQAMLLKEFGLDYIALLNKIDKVKSGDTTNQEAVASQLYWKSLFNSANFKRDRFGLYPNNFLNFSYAIVRAATARAIVGTGLIPSLGLFHKNQYNPFCLADDLMEPYRPYVDRIVYKLFLNNPDEQELSKDIKKKLLNICFEDVIIEKTTHPLQIGLQLTSNSLLNYFKSETKKLLLPKLCCLMDIE